MSFEQALRRAISGATTGPPQQLVAIAGRHPVDLDGFMAQAAAGGDFALWDTRGRGGPGEQVVAAGSVHVVTAEGPGRFQATRERVAKLLRTVACIGSAAPRCFGGFAFEVGRLGACAPLGDARFVLPRWCAVQAAGETRLELVARRQELETPELVLQELERWSAPRRLDAESGPLATASDGASEFLRAGASAIDAVERGELEKVVVVRRTRLAGRISVSRVLSRLALEPETVRFALGVGGSTLVGATPELLIGSDGASIESEAVAGTVARRGADGLEIHALCASDKERREHAHVVRAIRQGLARVGADLEPVGTPGVRSLRHVHHLVTPIRGRAEGVHVLELVSALHPTPAVCGVPQERARAWLVEHEQLARGWFASPIGWVDAEGRGRFVVALRSAVLDEWGADLFAGAGIVLGSRVDRELGETEAKLGAMRSVLGLERTTPRREPAPVMRGAP